MGGSSTLVVEEKTSRLQVDHRLPLRIYYRAADSILRQARIYRKENNLIDLYVLLLRFSSLVMETIPQHHDYRGYLGREKTDFRKRLLDVLSELETLKPSVQKQVCQYNSVYQKAVPSFNGLPSSNAIIRGPSIARSQSLSRASTVKDYSQAGNNWTGSVNSKLYDSNKQEYSSTGYKWQSDPSSKPATLGRQEHPQSGYNWNGDFSTQAAPSGGQLNYQARDNSTGGLSGGSVDLRSQHCTQLGYNSTGNLNNSRPVYPGALLPPYSSPAFSSLEDRMNKLSFSIPTPTSDSLSRHSFLGPSVRKATVSNVLTTKVKYPSLIDASPTVIPSLDQNWHAQPPIDNPVVFPPPMVAPITIPPLKAVAEPVFYNDGDLIKFDEKHSSLVETAVSLHSQLTRQPSPPPVEAEVQCIPAPPHSHGSLHSHESGSIESLISDVSSPPPGPLKFSEDTVQSRKPKRLHISGRLMDVFMGVADANTKGNLETCGMLAGSFKEGIFYVTTLIIPKQEATADTCSTINEEDIFEYQDKHDLFQFGWIHTHPSQSCFMSSVDLHTHYSYQVMLPEAVAIVMAPTDSSRKYGIFRLAEPSGINVIQSCERRGFHHHSEPQGGGSIYEQCSHVLLDPKLGCDVVDLR